MMLFCSDIIAASIDICNRRISLQHQWVQTSHTSITPYIQLQKIVWDQIFSLLLHRFESDYQTPIEELSFDQHHHVKWNRHQVLIPDSLPNQSWRVTNIQRHSWSSFQTKNKCSVLPQWPRRRRQWLTWPIHASIHVPYYVLISIQPSTTPRIL